MEISMKRLLCLSLAFCLMGGMFGCCNLAGPDLLHPGSASDQMRRAKRYYPYPETDMGPTTTNVRPRGFENPIAEPSRSRWQLNQWEP
jgi:hypothetical protein